MDLDKRKDQDYQTCKDINSLIKRKTDIAFGSYTDIYLWIKEEYRDVFRDLQLQILEMHKKELKDQFGKISSEEFRKQRREIDARASLLKK